MEVHVVTAANRHLYHDELDEMFRVRHEIYVEDLHWRDPSPDGRERDQFDTDAAVYLIGLENGRVITGSRFLSTADPHLLSEVFPHLCTLGGVIRDPFAVEWTRGFIVPDRREGLGVKLKARFCSAVMEWCLREGIEKVGGIQDVHWLSLWRRFGWSVRVHGMPVHFGAAPWVPAYFDVSEEALAGVRRYARLDRSPLVDLGPRVRFIDLPARPAASAARSAHA